MGSNSYPTPTRFKKVVFTSLNSFGVLDSRDCGFGFSRLNCLTYSDMESQFQSALVPGLYAIVIPSGGGKSSMAEKFFQLDVDLVLPEHVENRFKNLRVETHRMIQDEKSTQVSWRRHNLMWVVNLRLSLEKYNFLVDPKVIFLHSPETAMQIGAKIIGIFLPTESLHKRWMRDRIPEAIDIGNVNRRLIAKAVGVGGYKTFDNEDDLVRLCAHVIGDNLGYVPGVVPNLNWTAGTALLSANKVDVTLNPRIRMEQPSEEDVDAIVNLCKLGRLPWWHLAIWSSRHRMDIIPDGGHKVNTYPWLHLSYSISDALADKEICSIKTINEMIANNQDWFAIYPYMDSATRSQGNVTLRALLKHLPADDFDNYAKLLMASHIGAHHAFMVSILVYYLGVVKHMRPELRNLVIKTRVLEVPEENWVSIHNEVHKLVRTYQAFFGIDLTDGEYTRLQYTACLYGRRNYALDPGSEILKRRAPRLLTKVSIGRIGHNQEEYIHDFRTGVELAYGRLGTKKTSLAWYDINDFFEKRYQWAASGSITNLPENMKHLKDMVDVIQYTKDGIIHLSKDVNKKMVMEKLSSPSELAYYILSNWGYNQTGLAAKPNEPAKKRVLMPGSFIHYVAMSYILGMVERTGDVGGVRIGNPEDNALSHFDMRLGQGTYNFMLDFADHNAQHSSIEMGIIISVLEDKFAARSNSNQFKCFVDWIVHSFFNMKIRDGPITHDVMSGLYTGWRGTTWINSVACQAYVYVGMCAVRRRYGATTCRYFEGAGDDVMMRFDSALDALRFYDCMADVGYDMQSVKQLLSHSKTEFLRVIGTGDGIRCCINRVMPSFISGDLERSSPTVLDRVGGAYATTRMLKRRGLSSDVVKVLYDAYMDKWLRVKIADDYVDIDRCFIHGRLEMGGNEIPDSDERVWSLDRFISPPKQKEVFKGGPINASKDYANVIARELSKFQLNLDVNRYTEKLAEGVYGSNNVVDPESLVNSGARVRVYVNMSNKYDIDECAYALKNSSSIEIDMFKRQWSRYNRYKMARDCCNISQDEFLKALNITINVRGVEDFVLPAYNSFLVPEYVLYNFSTYYRTQVALWRISPAEARHKYELATNAFYLQMHDHIEL